MLQKLDDLPIPLVGRLAIYSTSLLARPWYFFETDMLFFSPPWYPWAPESSTTTADRRRLVAYQWGNACVYARVGASTLDCAPEKQCELWRRFRIMKWITE